MQESLAENLLNVVVRNNANPVDTGRTFNLRPVSTGKVEVTVASKNYSVLDSAIQNKHIYSLQKYVQG